jgi:hypothetical protein
MINAAAFKIINSVDFTSYIKGNSKNIIFWDTCGILDILNLVSDSTNSTFISVLIKLNSKIASGEIISCSSKMVIQEVMDNYESPPYYQAGRFIDETVRNYNKVQSYLKELGQQDSYTEVTINTEAVLSIIESQIQALLNNTLFIEDDDYLKLARDRVVVKKAPGQRNEFKDCVIWETCIDISTKTRIDLYFISSNEKDYGKNGARLPEIQDDMDAHNIQFKHKITEFYPIVQ